MGSGTKHLLKTAAKILFKTIAIGERVDLSLQEEKAAGFLNLGEEGEECWAPAALLVKVVYPAPHPPTPMGLLLIILA